MSENEVNNVEEQEVDLNQLMMVRREKLKEVIEYRMKYKESSLKELASIISIETGTLITKSGLNHRFRKIKEIVEKIEKK